MIRNFRHRGLKRLYERGDVSRVRPDLLDRIRSILGRLDTASKIEDMRIPSYRLHVLKGDLKGYWSVRVKTNWRSSSALKREIRLTSIWSTTTRSKAKLPCR